MSTEGVDFMNLIKKMVADLRQTENFDEAALMQLVDDTNEEVAIKMLSQFHKNLSDAIQSIENGLTSDNSEMVWRPCHKLAGTAALLGFGVFGNVSREIENKIKSQPNIGGFAADVRKHLETARLLDLKIKQSTPEILHIS